MGGAIVNPWHSRAFTQADDRWGLIEDYISVAVGGFKPIACIVEFPDGSGAWWPYRQKGHATRDIEEARAAAVRYVRSALEGRKTNP